MREAFIFAEHDLAVSVTVAVVADQLAAIDLERTEFEQRERRLALTQRLFREKEDRHLILLGEIERERREIERFFDRSRSDHGFWNLAVSTEDDVVQVALFGFRRHAGRRARACAFDDDDWNFEDAGKSDRFRH